MCIIYVHIYLMKYENIHRVTIYKMHIVVKTSQRYFLSLQFSTRMLIHSMLAIQEIIYFLRKSVLHAPRLNSNVAFQKWGISFSIMNKRTYRFIFAIILMNVKRIETCLTCGRILFAFDMFLRDFTYKLRY